MTSAERRVGEDHDVRRRRLNLGRAFYFPFFALLLVLGVLFVWWLLTVAIG